MREIVSIDLKGRVTIPKYIREEVGIREGDRVVVEIGRDGRSIVIRPLTEEGAVVRIYIEGRERVVGVVEEIERSLPGAEIIDLRCTRGSENRYDCRVTVVVDTRDRSVEKALEELSRVYYIERL